MSGTLLVPGTLGDAVTARCDHPLAQLIAGGTDVVADLNRGLPVAGLISLRDVADLRGIRFENGQWRLGAMVTIAEIRGNTELAPPTAALGQATRSMGSRQIRNRATVGGNLCGGGAQRTLAPILLAHDAEVDIVGGHGPRTADLADVLAPQGSRLATDEILTAVRFAPVTGPQRFYRIGPRNAVCYPTVSVTVVVDEPARSVRVALGSVAPTAVRAPAAEALASAGVDWPNRQVGDELAVAFGVAAAEAAQPVSDIVASAAYRSHAVAVMARRALKHIFEGEHR